MSVACYQVALTVTSSSGGAAAAGSRGRRAPTVSGLVNPGQSRTPLLHQVRGGIVEPSPRAAAPKTLEVPCTLPRLRSGANCRRLRTAFRALLFWRSSDQGFLRPSSLRAAEPARQRRGQSSAACQTKRLRPCANSAGSLLRASVNGNWQKQGLRVRPRQGSGGSTSGLTVRVSTPGVHSYIASTLATFPLRRKKGPVFPNG